MKAALSVLLACALAANAATAQGQALPQGALVRVQRAGARTWDEPARLQRASVDSLIVTRGDTVVRYAAADLSRIDVSTGTRRHTLKGLGIGFLSGALTGAVIGYAQGDDHCSTPAQNPIGSESINLGPCFIQFSATQNAALGATILGLAGGVGGAIVGALYTTPAWRSVSLDGRVAPIAGANGKFGLSIAY